MSVTWHTWDALTGKVTGNLDATEWKVADPVVGSGQGSMTVAVRGLDAQAVSRLKDLTKPDAVGVLLEVDGSFPWVGLITARKWKRANGTLEVGMTDWRAWFYTLVWRDGAARLNNQQKYVRKDTEQMTVLEQIMDSGLGPAKGRPDFAIVTSGASGVTRDVTIARWKGVGESLDAVAGRDNGAEWWVTGVLSDDRRTVKLTWRAKHPGRGSTQGKPLFHANPRGGNIVDYEWPEDATDRRTHVTVLGEAKHRTPFATDVSPAFTRDNALRREQVSGPLSGVKRRATLFSRARAERVSRNAPIQSATLAVSTASPALDTYGPGDYARVLLKDEWLDEDRTGRIIDRQLSGGRAKGVSATVVVDLNDKEIPGDQRGGIVLS